jgi:hypothetical protein
MANILDTIKAQLGDDVIENISKQLGEGSTQVKAAIDKLLPTIMKGVSNKVDGDKSYLSKLDADGDGDVDLDDMKSFLGGAGGNISKTVTDLLGGNKEAVEKAVAADAGISTESASSLTGSLTSLVMKNLKTEDQKEGSGSIIDTLKNEVAGFASGSGSNIMGMLDGDGDGDVDLDDIKKFGSSLLGRFGKK